MKRKKRLFLLCLSFIILPSGCSKISALTNADAAFENFTLTLFQQDVSSTTLGLHYTVQNPESYGITESDVTYGEFSTDTSSALATLENCQAALEKFPYKALSEENRLTYDVLSSYLETSKEGVPYTLYEEPLSPVTGIHAQLPVLLAEYPFYTEEDVITYLRLIETTPDYFDSLIAFEQQKAKSGLFMADYTADEVIEQCSAFLTMGEDNYLLSTFEERLDALEDLSSTTKADYLSKNRTLLTSAVLPAYQELVSALIKLRETGKNTQGLCYLPGGKEYYCYLAARETGSSRSMAKLMTLIQRQLADDLLAMQNVLKEYPSITEKSASASSVPFASPDLILRDLQSKTTKTFPESQAVNVEVKYVPSALEPYLSPAFYLIPAIDNTTDNVIYINQAHSLDDLRLFTTLAHEGYPGHLYQTTYYASQNPNPLRTLFNFKGYVEGWATYAEMCSYYLSSLDKPYATLLQKNSSLILGLYAMADIGIHYNGWNLERTRQFFGTYGMEDETVIQEIYELIIGDPANYLAYYVGYVEILELKRDMIEKEGAQFSQKEFHRKFLDVGPAPFDIVREQLGVSN